MLNAARGDLKVWAHRSAACALWRRGRKRTYEVMSIIGIPWKLTEPNMQANQSDMLFLSLTAFWFSLVLYLHWAYFQSCLISLYHQLQKWLLIATIILIVFFIASYNAFRPPSSLSSSSWLSLPSIISCQDDFDFKDDGWDKLLSADLILSPVEQAHPSISNDVARPEIETSLLP